MGSVIRRQGLPLPPPPPLPLRIGEAAKTDAQNSPSAVISLFLADDDLSVAETGRWNMDLDPRLRPSASGERTPSIGIPPGGSQQQHHHHSLNQTRLGGAGGERPDTPSSLGGRSANQEARPSHDDDGDTTQPADHHQLQDGSGGPNDPKRSRACEACRGLKVRCEPDPEDLGPCKRCRKAGRECVVTAPSRKRQKKTDSRVSELEKKIDALTASLQARGAAAAAAAGHPAGSAVSAGTSPGVGDASRDHPAASVSPTTRQRTSVDEARGRGTSFGSDGIRNGTGVPERSSIPTPPTRRDHPPAFQPPMVMAGLKRKASERKPAIDEDRRDSPRVTVSPWVRPDQGDVVDRGIINMDMAAELYTKYTDRMMLHMPAVVFPPSMTVSELRRSKPTLFLAVMTAAATEMSSLEKLLQKELMTVFAEKVFLSGEKSIETVQAILLAVIWYWPPEHFEELKFYQLVHVAAIMALDIGLGRTTPMNRAPQIPHTWQAHPFRRLPVLDPTSIECRRTWLACYFLTCNTSIALHRPHLIRWTPFMAECVEVLQTSPEAAPTDKYFCHLVMQHRLGEETSGQFSLDDPGHTVDINDPRTQYSLKALERDLEKYQSTVTEDEMRPSLKIGYCMISLHMHEIALHTRTVADQIRPPFNPDSFKEGVVGSEPLSAAHINAISACLTAVDGMFTAFLGLSISEIRCLPVYNFVRVAYGVVILVKMYFSASNPNSELGKVINKDNLRVQYYLDTLLDKFRHTAADDRCRPASKFGVVLAMLKSWFMKQGKQKEGDGTPEAGRGSNRLPKQESSQQQQPQQQPPPLPPPNASTPLHLLSEVAAGSEASPSRNNNFCPFTSMRQPPQPFFHDTPTTSSSSVANSSISGQQQQQQPLLSSSQSQQQAPLSNNSGWAPPPLPLDLTLAGPDIGIDFSSLGFVPDPQGDATNLSLSEPWFSDVFENFADSGSVFQF